MTTDPNTEFPAAVPDEIPSSWDQPVEPYLQPYAETQPFAPSKPQSYPPLFAPQPDPPAAQPFLAPDSAQPFGAEPPLAQPVPPPPVQPVFQPYQPPYPPERPASPPPYVLTGYPQATYRAPTGFTTGSQSLGIAALACGALSFILPLVLSIPAIVLGVMGRRAVKDGLASNRGTATAGLVLGVVNIVLVVVGLVAFVGFLAEY